mgnify:FL=1
MNRRHSYSAADYLEDQRHIEDRDSRAERLRERRLADDMAERLRLLGLGHAGVRRYTATTAEKISARFDHDGQNFTDQNGNNLEEVLDSLVACTYHIGNAVYRFADGSTIVLYARYWDIK